LEIKKNNLATLGSYLISPWLESFMVRGLVGAVVLYASLDGKFEGARLGCSRL